MELTKKEVDLLQTRLEDIMVNIKTNMEIINNPDINGTFLEPILKTAVEISDKIFIQTQNVKINVII